MRRSPRQKQFDSTISLQMLRERIHLIRGQRVMIDSDLASLYCVTTRRLNEQVRRNRSRFPEEFAFHLTPEEFSNLMSQNATSSSGWGGRRKLPYAFTEHGVLMAANVLNSVLAVQTSIQVVRAFIALRESLQIYRELAEKVDALQLQYQNHDETIGEIFEAIRELASPTPVRPSRNIGFTSKETEDSRRPGNERSRSSSITSFAEEGHPAPNRSRRQSRRRRSSR